jgi:hypothetical protein
MNNNKTHKKVLILMNGKEFTVPPGGSLGLLALGNVGIRAWKKAKFEWEKDQVNGKK